MSKSRKPQFADDKALHFFKDGIEYKRIYDDKDFPNQLLEDPF